MKAAHLIFITIIHFTLFAQDAADWKRQAQDVMISRDHYGVPHIYGKTDADAIFGMMYAQCEDDFKRIERNYLDAMGLMSEAYGEGFIYQDLRSRIFMDTSGAQEMYNKSPKWLKSLCDAFAGGINYYLYTHPEVKPDLLTHFSPWMPFFFSEGSIGGDLTNISISGLEAFYGQDGLGFINRKSSLDARPTGSNGISIAPSKSISGNTLFLINPHTSFYFRSEQHVNSQEGLSAYGAATWGQFFIYQGFNEHCGWMHTSTYADAIDEYRETVKWEGDRPMYLYDKRWKPLETVSISIGYKDGEIKKYRTFKVYRTHHGPVVRREGEHWITFRIMERPLDALRQSFLRTKARGYKDFSKTMKIRTNSSNNTVYADKDGDIAYWHGNFIPKRNPNFDYKGLIDGTTSETDWKGLHKVKETIHIKNPPSGWLQNCNATPFTAAGPYSPKREDYAAYLAPDRENFRGINAVRVLEKTNMLNLDSLIKVANNPFLAAFEKPIPALITAFNQCAGQMYTSLTGPIDVLKKWNFTYGEKSVATTLAIYWAEDLWPVLSKGISNEEKSNKMLDQLLIEHASCEQKLQSLQNAVNKLTADFGRWEMAWGEVNRFQRLSGAIDEVYDDNQESIAVGFTSSRWGSLASYGARYYPNTKKRYGSGGNSFVAVVEFGDRVVARSVVSGGQSGDPESPHFTDQAELFCKGQFKDVAYYPADVRKISVRSYHPGK